MFWPSPFCRHTGNRRRGTAKLSRTNRKVRFIVIKILTVVTYFFLSVVLVLATTPAAHTDLAESVGRHDHCRRCGNPLPFRDRTKRRSVTGYFLRG